MGPDELGSPRNYKPTGKFFSGGARFRNRFALVPGGLLKMAQRFGAKVEGDRSP